MNSNWAVSNPKQWCCESIALSMPANLENSAVTKGLEKVSFHFNPKERECQRMFKLPHSCSHLTHQQSNAQNPPRQASTVHERWTSRCSSWILKGQRNQRSNCQYPLDHWKSERIPEKHLFLLYRLCQSLWLCGSQQTGKFLEMGIPDHLTCLLRNLYAGQEATVRTGHGKQTGSKVGKEYVRLYIVTLLI